MVSGNARVLDNMAALALEMRDVTRARRLTEEALLLQRTFGAPSDIALTLSNLTQFAAWEGAVSDARRYAVEAARLLAEHPDRDASHNLHAARADCELLDQRYGEARPHLRAALDTQATEFELIPDLYRVADCLHVDVVAAARLLGGADALATSTDNTFWQEAGRRERLHRVISEKLGQEEAERELATGSQLTGEDLLEFRTGVLEVAHPAESAR